MQTKILRVVRQGEAFGVQSAKAEGGTIQKCNIVLREMGGSKFENEYVRHAGQSGGVQVLRR